jgi:hypothetical protein
MRTQRWMLLAALGIAANAAALDVAGISVADTASVDGKPLVLNGAGLRKRMVFSIYVGSLYLPDKATTLNAVLAQAPRRIRLDVLRNLSADQLIDALASGIRDNVPADAMSALAVPLGEMAAIMKSLGQVREGSFITLDFIDGATVVGVNGELRGTIAGVAFNDALTKIWIGDHPVSRDLAKAMLGGA